MGIVIDTSIFVAHERKRGSVTELAKTLTDLHPDRPLCASVITIAERTHGVFRAPNPAISGRRQAFIKQLQSTFRIIPVSLTLARIIGQIEGQQAAAGRTIDLADLIIAATAIQRGDSILTLNTKHFTPIPGLTVLAP